MSDPEFSEAVKKAKSCGEAKLVSEVAIIAHDRKHPGQLTACMFLLNTVHGYSKLSEIKIRDETESHSRDYVRLIELLDAGSDQDRKAFASFIERLEENGCRRGHQRG